MKWFNPVWLCFVSFRFRLICSMLKCIVSMGINFNRTMAQRKWKSKWKWKQDIIKFNAYKLQAIFFAKNCLVQLLLRNYLNVRFVNKAKAHYFSDDVSEIYLLPRRKHRTKRNIERLSLYGGGGRPRDGSRSFQFIAHGWILPPLHAFIPCFNQLVSTIMILSYMFLGIWGSRKKRNEMLVKN